MPASTRIASRSSNGGRDPPFTPHPQLDVCLAERLGEVLDGGLQLRLALAGRGPRVLPPRQRLAGTVEELLLPLGDRRLRQLHAPGDLDLGHLALQHAQDDLQLLVRRPVCLASHPASSEPTPIPSECPRKSDPRHTRYIYGERVLGRAVAEPGPYHNFPTSFDEGILGGTRTVVSDSYVEYTLPGTINGVDGVFEIGTRPAPLSDGGELITHRFFQPGG
jgi:hypothetical protein